LEIELEGESRQILDYQRSMSSKLRFDVYKNKLKIKNSNEIINYPIDEEEDYIINDTSKPVQYKEERLEKKKEERPNTNNNFRKLKNLDTVNNTETITQPDYQINNTSKHENSKKYKITNRDDDTVETPLNKPSKVIIYIIASIETQTSEKELQLL